MTRDREASLGGELDDEGWEFRDEAGDNNDRLDVLASHTQEDPFDVTLRHCGPFDQSKLEGRGGSSYGGQLLERRVIGRIK